MIRELIKKRQAMWMKNLGRALLSFLLLLIFFVLDAGAQPDPAAMASGYGQDAQQNAALMRQYSWKMRVEVTVKDEIKAPKMYQMRFDADGKPQKTLLTAEEKQKKKRGVRGRVQKKKEAGQKKDPSSWTELDWAMSEVGRRMRCRLDNARRPEAERVECL